MPEREGPLAGLAVVELAGLGPAQLGAMVLSDLGAEVVRIDRAEAAAAAGEEPSRELLGRGRRSVALDLGGEQGRERARALIARADVLVDPYRPGVTERLGLGPEQMLELNPGLVYARMTGWGQEGPLARAAGHDINYVALAGALEPTGEAGRKPMPALNCVADFGGGGLLMVIGVLAALREREGSGRGQVVDAAMVDGVALQMAGVLQLDAMGQWERRREANWMQGGAPWYRAYETADGRWLSVGPLEPKFYAQLLERLGLDPGEWPQHDRGRWPGLAAELAARFAAEPLAHWRAELEGSDVCFAPALRLDELAEHPQLAARGTYVQRDGMLQPAPAPRFSRTPGAIAGPPPRPGEHTEEVLSEL